MPDEPRPGASDVDNDTAVQEPVPEAAPKKHYDIDIYEAWCKQCGICAAFCPRGCIRLDAEGKPVVTNSARCTGCRWCELHCPDFAIRVRECEAGEAKEVD
jgi:2-oxoglutarate ferredoxin oxidoreductase subunit delta